MKKKNVTEKKVIKKNNIFKKKAAVSNAEIREF